MANRVQNHLFAANVAAAKPVSAAAKQPFGNLGDDSPNLDFRQLCQHVEGGNPNANLAIAEIFANFAIENEMRRCDKNHLILNNIKPTAAIAAANYFTAAAAINRLACNL